jgi:hypothetical protein
MIEKQSTRQTWSKERESEAKTSFERRFIAVFGDSTGKMHRQAGKQKEMNIGRGPDRPDIFASASVHSPNEHQENGSHRRQRGLPSF